MMRIQGGSQNYAWGRIGAASWVTRFLNGEICQQSPYAEYWLGTHPSLPSMANGQLLSNITGNLPYLFKVLSIAKPLSIQIHPNKTQAEILHGISKVLYPDNNHKPELCIAKGKMRLFIGFKTMEEISNMLEQTPELLQIVGRDCLSEQLKSLYKNEEETKKQVENYCARMQGGLFCELNQSFPGDIGVFFAMFMNFLELNNTESVVIGPGVPHCYIEGECIEAMACSDNVIRAGLTQKAKDVKTLLEIVDYSDQPPIVNKGVNIDGVVEYLSGFDEFLVRKYEKFTNFNILQNKPALGIVTEGKAVVNGTEFNAGDSLLVHGDILLETEYVELYLCS